jgi:hypothetical protein
VLLSFSCASTISASAQSTQPENKQADSIRGTVVNSVTHEPIGRALVYSPDNHLATMTDSEGHFEFSFAEPENNSRDDQSGSANKISYQAGNRNYALMARKPGFLDDRITQGLPTHTFVLGTAAIDKDFTLSLTPEALVVGRVVLPTAESSDTIRLELYRRQVQEGLAHWVLAGSASTRSNGEFRFAELSPGKYKLLTRELLDRDPLIFDPRGQLFGYPPVYFPNATDFAAAQTIQLSAGQILQADISLVRQKYYPIKVPVANAPPGSRMSVVVSVQGNRGPGFALGYNNQNQMIEGLLPNGNYTLEASSFGPNPASGLLNISVKGAALEGGSRMILLATGPVGVNVREEFTSAQDSGLRRAFGIHGQSRGSPRGPRSYLNLRLEPADDFGEQRGAWLRPPSTPQDESLAIDGVQPGRYWVRADTSRGFVAAITSGTTDLQHQPFVVGSGGSDSPIEITMRDATAEIEGTIESIAAAFKGTGGTASTAASPESIEAHVYCVPLPDSAGEFRDIFVPANGEFSPQPLPPGTYRVLAFDRTQPELEYRSPEAMRAYEAKGQLVRLVAGQKEHLQLQLISTSE